MADSPAVVDLGALRELAAAGYLTCRQHPTEPLLIWNYTQKTQWERHWTPETMACRGLITTPEGEVAARPFGKFFNAGEWTAMGRAIPVGRYQAIALECADDLLRVPTGVPRREQAAVVKGLRHPAMLFRCLDGKPYEDLIWKAIYPPPANAFRRVDEAVA